MRRVLLLLLCAISAFASSGLVVESGDKYRAATPNTAAYAGLTQYEIEFGLNDMTPPAGNHGIVEAADNGAQLFWAGNATALNWYTSTCGYTSVTGLSGLTDVRGRAKYDTVGAVCTLELWNERTGAYRKVTAAMSNTSAVTLRNVSLSIGSFYEAAQYAGKIQFIRIRSGVTADGVIPPRINPSATGRLLYFEFEQTGSDNPTAIAADGSTYTMPATAGAASYATLPTYAPAITLVSPVTAAVGQSASLDASGSIANIDSGAFTCTWVYQSGAGTPTFGTANECVTNATFPAFGEYNIRLTVTDSASTATQTDFKVGAVNVDAAGNVTDMSPTMKKILGPVKRFGASPFAWEETARKYNLDLYVGSIDTYWKASQSWNTPATGTFAATYNSFDFTAEAGTPNLTGIFTASKHLILWYPSLEYPDTYGRGYYTANAVTASNYHTGNYPYKRNASGTTTGIQYSVYDSSGGSSEQLAWWGSGGSITANYYEGVLALYKMYFSTGLTAYLTKARNLADRFWESPFIDRGLAAKYQAQANGYNAPRQFGTLSMMARAADGKPEMWTGIRMQIDWAFRQTTAATLPDQRETGYTLDALAMGAMLDPDPTYKAQWVADLVSIADTHLQGAMRPGAPYTALLTNRSSFPAGGLCTRASTVRVIDGSTAVATVTGNPDFGNTTCAPVSGTTYWNIWFVNTGTTPPSSNADGDSRVYRYTVTGSTLTLTEPYDSGGQCPGPNGCVKGWSIYDNQGYGVIAYMAGILLNGFENAAAALTANGDATNAARYLTWANDTATWLRTTGYATANKAFAINRDFVTCANGDVPVGAQAYCDGDVLGSRQNSGETLPGLFKQYERTKDAALKTFIDDVYASIWAKPGTSSPVASDGTYMLYLEPAAYMNAATNGIWNDPTLNKWAGFFWGKGDSAGWPAMRDAVAAGPRRSVSGRVSCSGRCQ